jgi:hypothetical protein
MRAWIASTTDPEKQNVPPFRGGTWQAFYAGGGHCQPVTRRPSSSTKSPRDAGLPRKKAIAVLE